MRLQAFEPAQLIVKFRSRCGVAIRHIETANERALDGCLDVAALAIVRIARQAASGFYRVAATSQDCNAVPAFLAMPNGAISHSLQRRTREFVIRRLQFLQAHDIGVCRAEPALEHRQTAIDAIHIIGCYFQ